MATIVSTQNVAGQDTVRILQITDFHLRETPGDTLMGVDTEASLLNTLAVILDDTTRPDLALLTGDLVQDATVPTYARLNHHLQALPCEAYCLPGNHDDPALMSMALAGGRVHVQPQILLKHWQIVCLDSTVPKSAHGRLDAAQLGRLEQALSQYPQHYALIAVHHHPVPCGSAWMDTMQIENAEDLFAVLQHHPNVRGIVCGHVHQVIEAEYRGIPIFGTPSTCFQFMPGQAQFGLDPVPPGYRWLALHADGRIRSQVQRTATLPAGLEIGSAGY